MKPQSLILVSHCVLNTAAKVERDGTAKSREEGLRRAFVSEAVAKGVQLLQLPCPEFTAYGPLRWGHTREQFDNAFFRSLCRNLLQPVTAQLEEYLKFPDRFRVLGIVGIDGSPSCGVKYTCSGCWGGELSGCECLAEKLADVRRISGNGIMIQELSGLLNGLGIRVPLIGLNADEPEQVMDLLL